jgi:hypothetical protein
MFYCQLQNLAERIYRILTSDWIALQIPNMIIRSQHYANHVIRFLTVTEAVSYLVRSHGAGAKVQTDERFELSAGEA